MDSGDFEILRQLYKAELRYTDQLLGMVLSQLNKSGLREKYGSNCSWDYGENIGDHGLMDHQYGLFNTLLHVPLIVELPEERTIMDRHGLTEVRDLYSTNTFHWWVESNKW